MNTLTITFVLMAFIPTAIYVGIKLVNSLNRNPKCESPIEWRLYSELKKRGYDVRTQTKCGPYRIDLTIGNIAIECDGKAYHSTPKQRAYDRRRSAYLYRNGYTSVLRFSGSEIMKNPAKCISKIEDKVFNN